MHFVVCFTDAIMLLLKQINHQAGTASEDVEGQVQSPVSVVPAAIFALMQGCEQIACVEAGCCGHCQGYDAPSPSQIGEGIGQR